VRHGKRSLLKIAQAFLPYDPLLPVAEIPRGTSRAADSFYDARSVNRAAAGKVGASNTTAMPSHRAKDWGNGGPKQRGLHAHNYKRDRLVNASFALS